MKKLKSNTFFRVTLLACFLGGGILLATFAQKQPPMKANAKADASTFKITVVPVGLSDAELQTLNQTLLAQPAVKALQSANIRHLYTQLSQPEQKASQFQAVFYDYSNQRTFTAEGSLTDPAAAQVRVQNEWRPPPSDDEFQDAVSVLKSDRKL